MKNEIKTIVIDQTKIQFRDFGQGEPVLMLHGNPGTNDDFKNLLEPFGRHGFRCIVPDRPGHGGTNPFPEAFKDFSKKIEFYGKLMEETCGSPFSLIGYSLGCFLSLWISLQFPKKVKNLVLLAPFVFKKDQGESPSSIPQIANLPIIGSFIRFSLPLLASKKIQQHIQNVFSPSKLSEKEIEEYLKWMVSPNCLLATIADKNDFLSFSAELEGKLSDIEIQVLSIAGKNDLVCDATETVNRLGEKIKSFKNVFLENAGHSIPLTHGERISEIVQDHFRTK
ncbi:alpha/beta hydrolase [bacterium]|nr:alpha/beta hydrolase [bacterium]